MQRERAVRQAGATMQILRSSHRCRQFNAQKRRRSRGWRPTVDEDGGMCHGNDSSLLRNSSKANTVPNEVEYRWSSY
jgi:hypothetical protein